MPQTRHSVGREHAFELQRGQRYPSRVGVPWQAQRLGWFGGERVRDGNAIWRSVPPVSSSACCAAA